MHGVTHVYAHKGTFGFCSACTCTRCLGRTRMERDNTLWGGVARGWIDVCTHAYNACNFWNTSCTVVGFPRKEKWNNPHTKEYLAGGLPGVQGNEGGETIK